MQGAALLLTGLLLGGVGEYTRPLGAKKLDQATLDAEGYGEKKALKREDDGLRITLAPGEKETGWKTPQQLKIGGDFTITANLVIRKLPKPAMEDGAAVGLALALQNLDQPEVTLVRLVEPSGSDVYRSIDRSPPNPMQMQQPMMMMGMMGMGMGGPAGKPPKPPRPTFPAAGETLRIELQREGGVVRFQVQDGKADRPRYLGQAHLGTNDVSALKLFASNRNGAEAVNVLLRDLTIRADRITGLGTVVRTVFGEVVYADPTSLEGGTLVVGGEPKTPPPSANAPGTKPGEPATKPAQPPTSTPAAPPQLLPAPAAPAAPAVAPAPAAAALVQAAPVAVLVQAPPAAAPVQAQAAPAQPPKVLGELPKNVMAADPPPKPKEPKARIPLDEVESIRFERTPAPAARFMGQPNVDVTMPHPRAKKDDAPAKDEPKKTAATDDALAPPPGTAEAAAKVPKVEPKENGIRDLYLRLANLREAAIKQVTVNCQTDKGPTGWRLDTTDSQDWPLVLRRSGSEAWADLFLEPPPGDCHQKDFTINVTYADGQSANVTAKADAHTDPKLAFDPKAPAPPLTDTWVHLAGDERLFGKLETAGEESLRLTTPWQDHVDVPLSRVAGLHFGHPDRKETPESFAKRLKARGREDTLLAQTKDGEVVAISGLFEGLEGGKLRFRYQDKSRTVPLKQVEGLVLAARPDVTTGAELYPTFSLPGATVSGRWTGLDTAIWKVQTAWGAALSLPAAEVQSVRFRGGRVTYLADLSPSKVEETPFFGRRLPWRRNTGLLGDPLKMAGQTFESGVAVHSRCVLTYDLGGRYATFEALVGFDDAAKGKGRVDCRVFADGKEIYANPDLRADGPPVKLTLPVAGAEQLRLRVDFGQGQDTGDRVIWADARLTRRPPPAAAASRDTKTGG